MQLRTRKPPLRARSAPRVALAACRRGGRGSPTSTPAAMYDRRSTFQFISARCAASQEDPPVIDFRLTSEQSSMREMARSFSLRELVPRRREFDEHGCFPTELYQQAFDLGFMNAILPKTNGGLGLSMVDLAVFGEEIAYGDLGFATSLMVSLLATGPLIYFGTEEQRNRWLSPLSEKLSFCSFAMTEPEGSSPRAIKTRARRADGGYVLDGSKAFITNAAVADWFAVFARVDGDPGLLSCFIVPADAPGVTVGSPYRKMGQRASTTAEVSLAEVRVSAECRVGNEGDGERIAMASLCRSRTGVGVMGVGVARAARDLVVDWAHVRRLPGGFPLVAQQDYRFSLAELDVQIETARSMAWRACWEQDNGPDKVRYSSIAKLYGGNVAVAVTGRAVEMLGGTGYVEEGIVEKLMRDAKLLQIYEGPQAVQKMLVAEFATKRARR